MFSIKIIRFWFPAILYSGIIFIGSSWPNVKTPMIGGFPLDKVIHFFEYIPFGFLVARALVLSWEPREKQVWLLAFFISVLYSLSDEVHQGFVLGRTFAVGDMLADMFGALMGIWFYQKKRITFKN